MDIQEIKKELLEIYNSYNEDSIKKIIKMHIDICDELINKDIHEDKVKEILQEIVKVLK